MKYHINGKHEVQICHATQRDCPFTHFSNRDEAEQESQRRLQDEFALIPTVARGKKHRTTASRFVPLAKKGVRVSVENPMGQSHRRDEPSVTILTGTRSSDNKLLAKIRNGEEKAFAA